MGCGASSRDTSQVSETTAGAKRDGVAVKKGTGNVSAKNAKDKKRAAEFRKACDGGHAQGCSNLGVAYHKGEGVAKNAKRAATLFRKACRGGVTRACAR